ncbi:F-box protein [Sesbania bispinosa]|nr:F-box protein [Sesbania bispinosa]
MSTDDSFSDHKLCGFLCAVLTVTPPDNVPHFNERCEIFSDGAEVGFRCPSGVVLTSLECGSSKAKRTRKIGAVNGSVSVVHQLHALVSRNCMKIDAHVVCVEVPRAVVVVDVYLPIQLWSGWQFPRSGSVAGAIFRHLRFASLNVLL